MDFAVGPEMIAIWALCGFGAYQLLALGLRTITGGSRRGPGDSASQLRYVAAAAFTARRVMNKSEYRVFRVVEETVAALGGGRRVFCQTALGEVLACDDAMAFRAINAKRVDILVVGPDGMPQLAIEYQGPGHYQGDAAARDAVKREALRKAGVAYLEIFEHHTLGDIAEMTRRALGAGGPARVEAPGNVRHVLFGAKLGSPWG